MRNIQISILLLCAYIALVEAQNNQNPGQEDEEECPVLFRSGSISVTRDNQTIENLVIDANDSYWDTTIKRADGNKWQAVPGITCLGFSNVTIRNVYIRHYPQGLDAPEGSNAKAVFDHVVAENPEAMPVIDQDVERDHGVNVIPSEAELSPYSMGIYFEDCQNLTIENVRIEFVDPPQGHLAAWKNYNI